MEKIPCQPLNWNMPIKCQWDEFQLNRDQLVAMASEIIDLNSEWLKWQKERWKIAENADVLKQAVQRMEELGYKFSRKQRGYAVFCASSAGELKIVNLWLSRGEIDDLSRGVAVANATEGGHLEIIETLMNSGTVPDPYRIRAAVLGASKGHLQIVRTLLSTSLNPDLIPLPNRKELVIFAAKMGAKDLLAILLPSKDEIVAQDLRELAVYYSAQAKQSDTVFYILKQGPISLYSRGHAVELAAFHGDQDLLNKLLSLGPISAISRDFAIRGAQNQGHQKIANQLTAISVAP